MSKIKTEEGNHLLAVAMVAVILGIVGLAGYRVLQNQKNGDNVGNKTQETNQTDSDTTVVASKKWTNGAFAVKGTYADADVVQIGESKWRMYYAIQPEVEGNNFEIYSATSTDGKSWKQESGTRQTMATFPDVVQTEDGKWRMYFQQAGAIKSAISEDGLEFSDESGTRIDTTNSEGLKFDNVAAPTTYRQADGSYVMVYRGTINERYAADTPNSTTQLLMWATSKDGLDWTKKGIAVDSRNSTLRGQLDGPDIVKWDDGKLHIFSTNYDGVFEFVFENNKFSSGEKAFALEQKQPVGNQPMQATAPPGDPTLAKIGDTWYMYYGIAFEDGGIFYATYK